VHELEIRGLGCLERGIRNMERKVELANEMVESKWKQVSELRGGEKEFGNLDRKWKMIRAKLDALLTRISDEAGLEAGGVDSAVGSGEKDAWEDCEEGCQKE